MGEAITSAIIMMDTMAVTGTAKGRIGAAIVTADKRKAQTRVSFIHTG
jgi:hypothetical protein